MIQVPVTFETHGIRGARSVTLPTASRNPSSAPSIRWEWNARDTRSRRASTPRPAASRSTRWIAAVRPDSTHCRGPFTAASATSSPSHPATSASDADTASIAPSGVASISRPRAATSARASSSDRHPATHAATSSPTLCPSIASGVRPQAIHSRASAYSTTNRAGCVIDVRSRRRAASSSSAGAGNSSARMSRPRWRSSRDAQASTSARNTGSVS
ncbi:hypothetical protein BE18_42675 [Sorangium cellulosum]|uniref:Uncharacterized protein n=1 Tax=Sorangium cellulosum TaxID=56 RepID=A0A150SDW1_SORCE|nr:hypothetical protein BE18_42675 [Sorangium cellulosum]